MIENLVLFISSNIDVYDDVLNKTLDEFKAFVQINQPAINSRQSNDITNLRLEQWTSQLMSIMAMHFDKQAKQMRQEIKETKEIINWIKNNPSVSSLHIKKVIDRINKTFWKNCISYAKQNQQYTAINWMKHWGAKVDKPQEKQRYMNHVIKDIRVTSPR